MHLLKLYNSKVLNVPLSLKKKKEKEEKNFKEF